MIELLTTFQWIILVLTALCIGMSKTGVQGLMLLAVPYMAMAFGAKESTGVILPMLCMADIIAVVYYKRIADWKVVIKLLPTAILGFFVAILVDKLIPANEFRQLMGWTLALVLVVMAWSELFGKENRWMRKWWYYHDWQCRRTGAVDLFALDAQGEDGVYRHQCLVFPCREPIESTPPNICVG